MKQNQKVSEILTFDLNDEESKIVWKNVKEHGFPENLDGLKSFVLACCGVGKKFKSQQESVKFSQESVKATVDFIQNNPEILNGAKDLLVGALKKKIFGK